MLSEKKELKILLDNWHDEKESAFLYHALARHEKSEHRKEIYQKLATIEDEHAHLWEKELTKKCIQPIFKLQLKIRGMLLLGKICGFTIVAHMVERMERTSAEKYFNQIDLSTYQKFRDHLQKLLPAERGHSSVLLRLHNKPVDRGRWHRGAGGIRDIIFGMNDGLLSTFSLIAGVAGGSTSSNVILLAGVAGAVAGSISMAAGAFVSTRAEREIKERQLTIERKEIEHFPAIERQELSLLYQLKGIEKEKSDEIAQTIIANKEVALETMAKEELGFDPQQIVKPLRAALLSGGSFVIGSAVPIVPFLIMSGNKALYTAIASSLSGFFVIGAVRTLATGKKAFHSGLEMFLIGSIAALLTYFIGTCVGKLLQFG